MSEAKTVKIKMLKNIIGVSGEYLAGKEYDVDEKMAAQFCEPIKYSDRNEFFVRALRVSAPKVNKRGVVEVPIDQLSVAEMRELGAKNITEIPDEEIKAHNTYLENAGFKPTPKNDRRREAFVKNQKANREYAETAE